MAANRSTTIAAWLISLINPPPLKSMSKVQKVARVALFTLALLILCILFSMAAAAGIFALQHGRHMFSGVPQLIDDLAIIFASMMVNTVCVLVLLHIKNTDQKLIPPPPETPAEDNPDSP